MSTTAGHTITIAEIMTSEPVTLNERTSVARALSTLDDLGIRQDRKSVV